MELARITVAGWAVATIVAGGATTGCGNHHEPSPPSSSTTSSSAASSTSAVTSPPPSQPTDYSSLLIKPSDIGGDFTTPQPPVQNPNGLPGVLQLFVSPDKSRRIGDSILILNDADAAKVGVDNTKAYYVGKVGGTWQPVDIGSNGFIISGNSPDNAQSVTVLVFSEGRAVVNLEFDGAPNDPIDPAVATDIARKQDAAIKSGLPG